jgi:hypothetical protein
MQAIFLLMDVLLSIEFLVFSLFAPSGARKRLAVSFRTAITPFDQYWHELAKRHTGNLHKFCRDVLVAFRQYRLIVRKTTRKILECLRLP